MSIMKKSTAMLLAVLMLFSSFACLAVSAVDTYTKVTSLSQITAGSKYLVVYAGDNSYVGNTVTSNTLAKGATVSGDTITTPDASLVWTLEASATSGKFYMKNDATEKYLGNKTSGTNAQMTTTAVDLAITSSSVENAFVLTFTNGTNERELAYYNETGFRMYATTTGDATTSFYLYKLGGSTPAPAGTKTIYFTNNKGWSNVYVYAWNDTTGDQNAAWDSAPAMQFVENNDYNEGIYSYNCSDSYDHVIFHNGNGTQTVDVATADIFANGNNAVYPDQLSGGKYTVGYWKYEAAAQTTFHVVVDYDSGSDSMGTIQDYDDYYEAGTTLDFIAIAETGYVFDGWYLVNGANRTLISNAEEFTYTVTADANIVAVFSTPAATYEVLVGPAANGSVNPIYADTYTFGTTLTATAVPDAGYKFVRWEDSEGVLISTEATLQFTVDKNIEYYAIFAEDVVVETGYNKVTSVSELTTDGKYLFVVKDKNTAVGNSHAAVATTTSTFSTPDSTIVWTLEKSGDNYLIKNESSGKYLSWSKSTTGAMKDAADAVANAITANDNGTFTIVEQSKKERKLALYESTTNNFRWYLITDNSHPYEFEIYKYGEIAPAVNTTKLYFTNPGWSKVQVYAWDSTKEGVENAPFATAPEMTFVENNEYNQGIYSYDLPETYDKVIFHNGAGTQSADIAVSAIYANGNNAVYLDGNTVGYWKYTAAAAKKVEVLTECDTTMGTITVSAPADGKDYYAGEEVTFTATAKTGYTFVAWCDENDTAVSTSATYKITLTDDVYLIAEFAAEGEEPPVVVDQVYNKITAASQITAGGKYVFVLKDKVNDKSLAIATPASGTTVKSGEVTATTSVTNPADAVVWTLEASGNNFVIKNVKSGKYIKGSASATTTTLEDVATGADVVFEKNDDDSFKIYESTKKRYFAYLASSDVFRTYASGSNPSDFYIYKLGAEAPAAKTNTIYFTNPGWTKVQVYAWDSTAQGVENAPFATAPEMTYVADNEYNQGIYSYDLPETYDKVIFHNGAGTQTADVTVSAIFANGNNAVYVDGNTVGYWKYQEAAPVAVTVNVTSEDDKKGIVVVSDPADGKKYYTGEEVTLTAVADTGYIFSGWYDSKNALVSEDEIYKVTLTGDIVLVAKFTAESEAPSSEDKDYTKVTSAAAITAGDYIFVITSDNVAINSTKTGTAVTAGDKISTHDNTIVWTLEATEGGFAIKNKDTGKYMKGTSSGATLTFADTGIVIAFTDNNNGTFKLISAEINNKKLAYYNKTDFRWYAQSNTSPSDFYVYKLGSGTPTVDENAVFFTNPGWSKVQIYAWNATTHEENAAFANAPEMTFVENNEYNQGIYTYSLDKTKYDHVIFHNGAGTQTADVAIADIYANGNNAVYVDGNTVGYWKYGTVVVAPKEVSVEVDTDDETMGTAAVSAPADGEKYYEGEEVTFTATAKTGYTFTGWYDLTDKLVSSNASYKITLEDDDVFLIAHFAEEGEEPEPQDEVYNKINSLADITANGKYVFVLADGNLAVDNTFKSVAVTGTSIKNPAAAIVWVVEASGDNVVIKNEALNKYMDWTSSTTATMAATGEDLKFTANGDGTFAIQVVANDRKLAYLESATAFKWYAANTSNPASFYVYKLGAEAPDSKKTIYFTNSNNWSKVYVYAWDSKTTGEALVANAASFSAAPEMTFVENNAYNQGVYSYELSEKYDSVIFHDGTAQTVDVKVADIFKHDNNAVYPAALENGKYTVGYWQYGSNVPVKVTVTAESDDTTMGTVAISAPADGKDYYTGEDVTFTATAKSGYKFVGWYDAEEKLVSNKAAYTVTLEANIALTAVFEEDETPGDKVYTLVSDAAGLTVGDEYVIVLASEVKAINDALTGAQVAVASNAITNPAANLVWVIEKSGDNYVLKNVSTGKYLNWSSGSTANMVNTAADAEPVKFESDGEGTFKIISADAAASNKHLAYYATNGSFRWYAASNTSPSSFSFYKLGAAAQPETFTTIYFTNGEGWTDVRIYAWNSKDETVKNGEFATAPKMTLVGKNEYNQDIYSYELSDKYDSIIFHNGTAQTVDVKVADVYKNGNNAVYPSTQENGKFTVGYWKYENTTPTKVDVSVASDNPTMGTVSVSDPADGKDYYTGETITLTATPKTGYVFKGWYDMNDELVSNKATYTFKLTDEVMLLGKFEAEPAGDKYTVTITAGTGGAVTGAQSGSVDAGTSLTVTATANEGYKFEKWTDKNGAQLSTSSVYTFTVNADTYVNAVFKKLHKITASVDKAAAGSVSRTSFYVDDNETFTITATANNGYIFAGWAKNGASAVFSSNATLSDKVTADTTYVAKFNQRGDVNKDGAVTMADVQLIQDSLTGKATLTAEQATLADVNADGSVNLLDAYYALTLTK